MNVLRFQMFDQHVWALVDERDDVAQCGALPELHDGPNNSDEESDEERAVREEVARQLCQECPARRFCLDYAVRVRPERGIWGGFTTDEIDTLYPFELGEVA